MKRWLNEDIDRKVSGANQSISISHILWRAADPDGVEW